MTTMQTLFTRIPATHRLLNDPLFQPLIEEFGKAHVMAVLNALQDEARAYISRESALPEWCDDWSQKAHDNLITASQSKMRPVFNLTGTVLHTNLGRAILAEEAIRAVTEVMQSAVTLEYSLDAAERSHRDQTVAGLLCELTGAEAACVVNNNAAAVLLMLAACAEGKEVIVSRGELVEIGGAFRIPDVMRQAGCRLVEVGTTNRTHARDYRQATGDSTALLMKVHTSNYQIEGFTQAVSEAELAKIAADSGLHVVADLGSGSLVDLTQWGLPQEPMPQQLIAEGVSLVSFSGDKLLGGPQAGIIVGKKSLIDRIQQHPLKRALRADKMTLAALEATLRLYQHPETLTQRLPTLRLLTRSAEEIAVQAARLQPILARRFGAQFTVGVSLCLSQIGSGSLPIDRLPSAALTFEPKDGRGSTLLWLSKMLRERQIPVIGRITDGRLWLDLRCLEQESLLLEVLGL